MYVDVRGGVGDAVGVVGVGGGDVVVVVGIVAVHIVGGDDVDIAVGIYVAVVVGSDVGDVVNAADTVVIFECADVYVDGDVAGYVPGVVDVGVYVDIMRWCWC